MRIFGAEILQVSTCSCIFSSVYEYFDTPQGNLLEMCVCLFACLLFCGRSKAKTGLLLYEQLWHLVVNSSHVSVFRKVMKYKLSFQLK